MSGQTLNLKGRNPKTRDFFAKILKAADGSKPKIRGLPRIIPGERRAQDVAGNVIFDYRINILDSIMDMMEKYARNMEENVEERAQQLLEEKRKTDRLLYRLLPA